MTLIVKKITSTLFKIVSWEAESPFLDLSCISTHSISSLVSLCRHWKSYLSSKILIGCYICLRHITENHYYSLLFCTSSDVLIAAAACSLCCFSFIHWVQMKKQVISQSNIDNVSLFENSKSNDSLEINLSSNFNRTVTVW